MHTEKHLMERICTPENAMRAYELARRTKRNHADVLRFEQNREDNLNGLIEELSSGAYEQGNYFIFKIYEPKERLIMSLPFRDRVAQHMICNIIEPIFDRRFYEHSYACRKRKGVHAASLQLRHWLHEMETVQGLKVEGYSGDVHAYFASIVHEILLEEIERYIGDVILLETLSRIVAHNGIYPPGIGDPVGNLTSQLFANVYLNILDRFILDELKPDHYIRYMDNFIPIDSDIGKIRACENEIPAFMKERLELEINPKSTIVAARNGIDFVGYRHWPEMTIMRKTMTRRLTTLIRDMENGETDITDFNNSYQSRIGHMKHADTYKLIREFDQKAAQAKERRRNENTDTQRQDGGGLHGIQLPSGTCGGGVLGVVL